jgi:hypothetical protein
VAFAPIFIVGVPRSGTTLLRVLLDSHSGIAALPETPWLLGAYGSDASLRQVLQGLMDGSYGAVRNVAGVEPDDVLAGGRALLEAMFEPMLKGRGKRLLAFKTPADIRHLDFLIHLAPAARFIHITRDGRDAAMSQLAKKDSFFHDLKEYRRVGFANLLRRWVDWEQRIRSLLDRDGVQVVRVKYEDLVAQPARELKRITAFLGLTFEPAMLDYAAQRHDYPAWEAGSTDVSANRSVSTASAGRWREARLTAEMVHALTKYDAFLVELGYPSSALSPSASHRAAAALFPVLDPILDAASNIKARIVRPLLKNHVRTMACATLVLLAGESLLPEKWLRALGLFDQPMFTGVAALVVGLAFGPAFLRRYSWFESVVRLSLVMLVAVGLLEAAQNLVPDRIAAWSDLLRNAGAAVAGSFASIALLRAKVAARLAALGA